MAGATSYEATSYGVIDDQTVFESDIVEEED